MTVKFSAPTGGFPGASAWAFFGSLGLVSAGIILFSWAGEVYALQDGASNGRSQHPLNVGDSSATHEPRKAAVTVRDGMQDEEELQRLWAGQETYAD